MSASAKNINNGAECTIRSAIIRPEHEDDLKDVITASTGGRIPTSRLRRASVRSSTLLAQGGYNDIWLAEAMTKLEDGEDLCTRFVLREPNDDSFLPYQLSNEVAWLDFVREHTNIPVPKVYKYSTSKGSAYIAMEFIEGQPLHEIWKDQSEEQKDVLANEIASVVVQLGETRLEKIGGLDLDGHLAPTVEGPKFFKGRDKIHTDSTYPVGPYSTVTDYVAACYTREIIYYSTQDAAIDWPLFNPKAAEDDWAPGLPPKGLKRDLLLKNRDQFVQKLEDTKRSILSDPSLLPIAEPFVLCHNDFEGRNILVRDGHIVAVLDWEFAGSYPLSELLSGGSVRVVELLEDEDFEEDYVWGGKIRCYIEELARERGWAEEDVDSLFIPNEELQGARVEMCPRKSDFEQPN